ncbi:hypothetical protein ABZ953_01175 [Streptomyces sp. NPDC046465]|uniref:hypothetical protein n=1 Tax=Streptomyces sp. NPDC046465 TaxID=3155810 RepID=UPI0033DF5C8F
MSPSRKVTSAVLRGGGDGDVPADPVARAVGGGGAEEGGGSERAAAERDGSAPLAGAEGALAGDSDALAEGGTDFVGFACTGADTGSPGRARSRVGRSVADERRPTAKTTAVTPAATAPAAPA